MIKLFYYLFMMYYNTLTISDVNNNELIKKIYNNLESEYIYVGKHVYSVDICEIDNITYLSSKIPYKSYEFENIFNFKGECSDFYKGKIVKIINYT